MIDVIPTLAYATRGFTSEGVARLQEPYGEAWKLGNDALGDTLRLSITPNSLKYLPILKLRESFPDGKRILDDLLTYTDQVRPLNNVDCLTEIQALQCPAVPL